MRRIVVFASAFALFGCMALAMDEEMMMEAPAPSVVIGGSGKIGIKNMDDEQFKLVRAYKVTFVSTGTTDGGLMFGAGMSIRDDTGEEDMPVVKGSHVYVGGADGSWKLQFGGNGPGIDLAGGFGVADDHFGGGDDVSIALSGSFGDTSFRITAAAPEARRAARVFDETAKSLSNYNKNPENDWSIGVSHSINTISVGVGMDSEDGLAIGIGADLSGVSTFIYWSKSEFKDVTVNDDNADEDSDNLVSQENTGLGFKASISAGEDATFSVGYSTLKLEQITGTFNYYDGTAETRLIEVDFTYDLGGGATLSVGIDKKDAESIGNRGATRAPAAINSTDTTTLEVAIAFSF